MLALLLYGGVLPLALAGAAAVAMRTAAQSVSRLVCEINRLYEASFFIAIFRSCLTDAAGRGAAPPATAELRGEPGVIELTGVSFRYPGEPEPALHDVEPDPAPRRGDRAGRGERLRQVHPGQAASPGSTCPTRAG